MSLSEQGKTRAALVLPGGPLHALFTAIQNEWNPDFKDGISRLDVSENDLMGEEMAMILKSFAAEANHNWLTYQGSATPSCSIKLLESLATLINNRFRPRQVVTPDQLVGGAGCSLLLEGLTRIICDDGDIILTPAPIWPIFHTIVANANVSLSVVASSDATATTFGEQAEVISSLLDWSEATKTRWTTRVQQLRSSGKKPRAVLLSNPQNPLGRCYSRSFILGILDFCQENDLFLISDEVFALSHHAADNQHASPDGAGFHSVLSVDAEADAGCDPSRIVALWSASKDFGATSARLAVAVIPQNDLLKAALSSLSFSFRISSLADCFFSTFLSAKSSYLPKPSSGSEEKSLVDVYLIENSARLRNAKRHLSDWCLSKNIQVLDSDFGNSLMINLGSFVYSSLADMDDVVCRTREEEFEKHLFTHRVTLQNGRPGSFPFPGWYRITFSRSREYMEAALARLDVALTTWLEATRRH